MNSEVKVKQDDQMSATFTEEHLEAIIEKVVARKFKTLPSFSEELKKEKPKKLSLVAHSGDLDKLAAVFAISMGAVAMGMEVSIFFTFWALSALKKKNISKNKSFLEKLMGYMLPANAKKLSTSKMNMLGFGPRIFSFMMKKNNVSSLPDMIQTSLDMGVKVIACTMVMDVMGIKQEEMIDGIEYGGVAAYLDETYESDINLFV